MSNTNKITRSESYILDATDFEIESQRLTKQAKELFEVEKPSLIGHGVKRSARILELGCGTGDFLKTLHENFPETTVYGIDRDERFIEKARKNIPSGQFWVTDLLNESSLKDRMSETRPTLVFARYVLQHLPADEQLHVLRHIRKHLPSGARLLLIDTDDSLAEFTPECSALIKLLVIKGRSQAKKGGDRLVGKRLESLMKEAGFNNLHRNRVDFSSTTIGLNTWEEIFWPVIKDGVSEHTNAAELQLIVEAKHWFRRMELEGGGKACVSAIHVSGE